MNENYANRFIMGLILLVIIQSVLVLLPSAMCQTVDSVPPSGIQILSIIPGNTNALLYWDLGNSGGSTFTGLYYSTDGGSTWAWISVNPSQTGSVSLAATSDGDALVNGDPYSFIIAASTEAFPDYEVNTPSPPVPVIPSASAPTPTPPEISAYGAVGLTFVLKIKLGSPGSSQFDKVYYSTNGGTNWNDTGILSNALNPGDTLDYTITLTSDTDAILLSDTQYEVVVATTTFANSTKSSSDPEYITTQIPGTDVQPDAPTSVYTVVENDYFDLYFEPPQNMGSGTYAGAFFSVDGGVSFAEAISPSTRITGVGETYTINGVVGVTTSAFPNAADIINTTSFSAVRSTGNLLTMSGPPTIESITPGNASLTVNWSPPINPGSGSLQALYYQVDTEDFIGAPIPNFNAGSFTITTTDGSTPLVNGTSYEIRLRITTSAFLNVAVATDSNMVPRAPSSSPVKPDVPVISRIFTGPSTDGLNAQFTFNFTLGSSGSAPFKNVYYTTSGSAPYVALPNNPTADGYVTITETSASTPGPLLVGTEYNVKIVSITDDFNATTNTNVSNPYSMMYTGEVVSPTAPILNSAVQVEGQNAVSLDFTLVNFGSDPQCQLWFSSDGGTSYREIPFALNYNPNSPIVVTTTSSSGVFASATYVFQLAMTNAFISDPSTAPQSNTEPLAFVPVLELSRNALRNARDLAVGKNSFTVETTTLGNEVCAHNTWKTVQSSSKDVVAALALALPTIAMWKLRVSTRKPLILALFFWISYHAIRDIRDKSVTTEYKIATRFEYFIEHLLFWLYYGCLISAGFSLIRV